MLLRGHGGARFELNVTQFRAPMSAQVVSVQTRSMAHHFPIRAGQPDVQFTVQFASLAEKHAFQDFVRSHQLNARQAKHNRGWPGDGSVRLTWPERDIVNWTGYVVNMPVREARYEYAPRVTFGVSLMDSMLSSRTTDTSLGGDFWTIAGAQIPAWVPWDDYSSDDDTAVSPPQPPSALDSIVQGGRDLVGGFLDTVAGLFR